MWFWDKSLCHGNGYDSTDFKYFYLFSREVASSSDLTILTAEVYIECSYEVQDSGRIFLNSRDCRWVSFHAGEKFQK